MATKSFWFILLSWLISTPLIDANTNSRDFFVNYFDEFLLEQKQYLALTGVTSAPPTGYVPFTIANNSGFSDTEVFLLILTNNFFNIVTFAPNADGLQLGTVATPPPRTYVNQSGSGTYPLSYFLKNGSYTFYLPSTVTMNASRIYYSVGQPLDWLIPFSGPVAVPAQDFSDPGQDGYYILFDKQEFTMVGNDRFVMNPTLVDYYGIPLSFSISYLDYSVNPAVQKTAYAGLPPTLKSTMVFSNYAAAVATLPTTPGTGVQPKYSSLNFSYAPPSGSSGALRILSPNQGIQTQSTQLPSMPLFPINYFLTNSYMSCDWLTTVWDNAGMAIYQTQPLYISLSTAGPTYGVAKGQIDGSGNFNFTALTGTGTGSTLVLPLPTSSRAFFTSVLTDYTPAPTITGDMNVATAIWQGLSAGVIAGVVPLLGTTQGNPLSQSFIRQQTLFTNNANLCHGPWYDFYSGTLIGMGSSPYTKFYTTPYGDYLGTDGTVTVTQIANAGAAVSITIGDMTGIPVPNPFNDNNNYTVVFNSLPPNVVVTFGTNPDFSMNPSVMSTGQTFTNVLGSSMYLGATYSTGNYPNQLWGIHLIPSAPAAKPTLPGLNLSLSGGVGGTLSVTLGGAP